MIHKFDYSAHENRTWEYYEVYLKRFRNNPSPILEMGCGLGLFLEACKDNDVTAIGVEFDDEGVAACTERGLEVYQHDLNYPLTFLEDELFEAVIANQVIEHIPPSAQENLVSEAYRLLKPGGQILLTSPCRHWEEARADKFHIALLTPSEIKKLVLDAGFEKENMGYNRSQKISGLPDEIVEDLWVKYRPDYFSKDATVLAYKPL